VENPSIITSKKDIEKEESNRYQNGWDICSFRLASFSLPWLGLRTNLLSVGGMVDNAFFCGLTQSFLGGKPINLIIIGSKGNAVIPNINPTA
jgi:hypothetical protein